MGFCPNIGVIFRTKLLGLRRKLHFHRVRAARVSFNVVFCMEINKPFLIVDFLPLRLNTHIIVVKLYISSRIILSSLIYKITLIFRINIGAGFSVFDLVLYKSHTYLRNS